MNFDLTGDWQYIDNVEAVTLYQRQQGDAFGATPVAVAAALRLPTEKSYVTPGGLLAKADLAWNLWPATFTLGGLPATTQVPKLRDVIQDAAGLRWSIVHMFTETLLSRFRCLTVRER